MNTYKKYIFWLTLISAFFVSSCDKYNSKITGKVFYVDANDNITYPASGAVITKLTLKNDSLYSISAVFANIEGDFLFEHQTKGNWKLSGKFEKDSVSYFGISEEVSTNGKDQIEQNIILKPVNSGKSGKWGKQGKSDFTAFPISPIYPISPISPTYPICYENNSI